MLVALGYQQAAVARLAESLAVFEQIGGVEAAAVRAQLAELGRPG